MYLNRLTWKFVWKIKADELRNLIKSWKEKFVKFQGTYLNRFWIQQLDLRNYFHFFSEGTRIQSQGGDPKYLTAICGVKDLTENVTTIGVCFVDTSIGVIHLAKFDDDKELSGLETLLALYPPAEILFDKSNKSLLNSFLAKFSAISKRPLPFPDGKDTLKWVHDYYGKFVKDNWFPGIDKSLKHFSFHEQGPLEQIGHHPFKSLLMSPTTLAWLHQSPRHPPCRPLVPSFHTWKAHWLTRSSWIKNKSKMFSLYCKLKSHT